MPLCPSFGLGTCRNAESPANLVGMLSDGPIQSLDLPNLGVMPKTLSQTFWSPKAGSWSSLGWRYPSNQRLQSISRISPCDPIKGSFVSSAKIPSDHQFYWPSFFLNIRSPISTARLRGVVDGGEVGGRLRRIHNHVLINPRQPTSSHLTIPFSQNILLSPSPANRKASCGSGPTGRGPKFSQKEGCFPAAKPLLTQPWNLKAIASSSHWTQHQHQDLRIETWCGFMDESWYMYRQSYNAWNFSHLWCAALELLHIVQQFIWKLFLFELQGIFRLVAAQFQSKITASLTMGYQYEKTPRALEENSLSDPFLDVCLPLPFSSSQHI